MTQNFDLVICAIERDIPTLKIGLPYLQKHLRPTRIVFIAPRACLAALSSLNEVSAIVHGLRLIDEDSLVDGLSKDYVHSLLVARGANPQRSGWYFQQLLKLCYSLDLAADDYYLVWDADTIPLRPMEFFSENGKIFFEKSREYNPYYFQTLKKLIGKGKIYGHSFISEHMMMERATVQNLLTSICSPAPPSAREVARRIIEAIDDEALSLSGFSEFETYGTFAASTYPDCYELRSLRSLRQGAMLFGRQPSVENLFALSCRYWWASFEAWPISSRALKIKRHVGALIGAIWTVTATAVWRKAYRAFLTGQEATE
jgi:hypothetical protein